MIISGFSTPDKSLYFIGANIISTLKRNSSSAVDPLILFYELNENFDLSMSYFVYSLDWLYIVGVLDLDDKGDIFLCD